MDNRFFLIGFMGVGKTTLGKQLAHKLGLPFIDVDKVIEEDAGISINSFFEKLGEEAFREKEVKALKNIIKRQSKAVISVGGGLPCFFDNMKLMNDSGVTCYLHRPAKELFHRLKNSKTKRPLVKDLNDEELLSFIEETLLEREEYYKKAQYTFSRNQQTAEEIKNILMNDLGKIVL